MPSFFQRLTRIVGSLAIVVALYGVYALAAVPLIEPRATARAQKDPTEPQIKIATQGPSEQHEMLQGYFIEGDWELSALKVLESSQGILLLNDYNNLDSGRVKLFPCTMIFQPQGVFASEADRRRRSVIVRCPEGAILQFEGGFDLKRAKIGKLIAGQLTGPITIRSDQKDPGPHDDLLVHARDLNLVQQQITSPHPVDFTLGPNRGSGRDLKIQLAPTGSQQGFRGVLSLELATAVEARVMPGGADVFPGGARKSTAKSTVQATPEPPVDIHCQGPFRFDFEKNVATFHDRVEVLRMHPEGPSDRLTSELLSLHFEPTTVPSAPATAVDGPAPSATTQAMKLEPVRMEAIGNPVVILAPSRDVEARAHQVEYDIKTGGATLSDEHEARLRQGRREISARQLFFEPDPSGQLGKFLATGRGWLKGTVPDDETQSFEAQWSRKLQFRPQEEYHVLSIEGAAHVQSMGKGSLDGDEIHLWLIKAPEVAAATQPVAPKNGSRKKTQLIPDRLLAVGNVVIDSPQITGKVGQMQTWFEHAVPPAAPATPALNSPLATVPLQTTPTPPMQGPTFPNFPTSPTVVPETVPPGVSSPMPGPVFAPAGTPTVVQLPPELSAEVVPAPPAVPINAPATTPFQPATLTNTTPPVGSYPAAPTQQTVEPPRQQYNIQAETLRVRARVVGHKTELAKVIAENNVRLEETRVANEGDKPLVVTGQYMELEQPSPEEAVATVKGQPGYLEARGMTLASAVIHVDRARSALWTDGPGKMTIPADRNLEGRTTGQPQVLEVTWQGTMDFGGQTATFKHEVLAQLGLQTMRTEVLEASFTRPVNLSSKSEMPRAAGEEKPQIDTVVCRQGSLLESRTFEGQRLMSIDRLQTADMIVHQRTGDVRAAGPGWLLSTRVDNGSEGMAALGGAGPGAAPAAPPVVGGLPEEKLAYLNVRFQRGMTGNLQRRVMSFEGQVRTIYGPIPQWDAQLDIDRPETWGERGIVLATEKLSVFEMGIGLKDKRFYEMEALGNTTVEGSAFLARAQRVTYAQSKDLLVLEGNGRTEAQLFRRQRSTTAPEEVADKIMYWPKTGEAMVEGQRYLDVNGPVGGKR